MTNGQTPGAMPDQFYAGVYEGMKKNRLNWAISAILNQEQLRKNYWESTRRSFDFLIDQLKDTDLGMHYCADNWYVSEKLGLKYEPLTFEELKAGLIKKAKSHGGSRHGLNPSLSISDAAIMMFIRRYGTFTGDYLSA